MSASIAVAHAFAPSCVARVGADRVRVCLPPLRPQNASFHAPRVRSTSPNRFPVKTRAAEMMGVPLYADDLLQQCAPWGNVCVVAGTKYIPIALPSIIASLFLFLPLIVVFLKLQKAEAQLVLRDETIEELTKKLNEE